jgi:hypothetical protein
MTKKTVTSLALAAGCALALAMPAAQAQTRVLTNGPEVTPGDFSSSAARNNAESREYMRLLQTNRSFREARMRQECGPITDMQLHQNCIASFDHYTPYVGSTRLAGNEFYPPNRAARGAPSTDMMTGSGAGAMTSTTTGMTGYGPGMNGAGYGSSVPTTNNYTTSRNNYGTSRNLPGEYNTGMYQAPGAMPNYPGPRVSGPISGGGGSAGGGASGGSGGAGGGAGGM